MTKSLSFKRQEIFYLQLIVLSRKDKLTVSWSLGLTGGSSSKPLSCHGSEPATIAAGPLTNNQHIDTCPCGRHGPQSHQQSQPPSLILADHKQVAEKLSKTFSHTDVLMSKDQVK